VDLSIGKFRSSVQFKVNIPEALGAGLKDSLFDYGSTRGYLKARNGFRSDDFGAVQSYNSHDLYIRYQPYYARVDLAVFVDGRQFTIVTVNALEEGKKHFLKFQLNEKL
jgi:hypothetical protein